MPTGRVTRFNDSAGAGYIETSSGGFSVSAEDMEARTQFEGAHVEFDVQREEGRDRAVNVTLREGTRHMHTQRRFGDTR
ncbi:MAG TPA: cold shock domain-containing protein [Egibacteraceae bacterium]|nr:cold shock domain-containing protein [Egibacteraceae bacterium]